MKSEYFFEYFWTVSLILKNNTYPFLSLRKYSFQACAYKFFGQSLKQSVILSNNSKKENQKYNILFDSLMIWPENL